MSPSRVRRYGLGAWASGGGDIGDDGDERGNETQTKKQRRKSNVDDGILGEGLAGYGGGGNIGENPLPNPLLCILNPTS
jgi:hypothetical protein